MNPGGFEPPSTGPKPGILSIELWVPNITERSRFLYLKILILK